MTENLLKELDALIDSKQAQCKDCKPVSEGYVALYDMIAETELLERVRAEAVAAATIRDLTPDVQTVLRGFAEGVFVRSTENDHESDWAVKLLPFIQALAQLQRGLGL